MKPGKVKRLFSLVCRSKEKYVTKLLNFTLPTISILNIRQTLSGSDLRTEYGVINNVKILETTKLIWLHAKINVDPLKIARQLITNMSNLEKLRLVYSERVLYQFQLLLRKFQTIKDTILHPVRHKYKKTDLICWNQFYIHEYSI